jgi:hypothetical protein
MLRIHYMVQEKNEEKRKNRKRIQNKKQKTKNKKQKTKNKKKHQISSKGIKCLNQEHVQQYCQWRPVPF